MRSAVTYQPTSDDLVAAYRAYANHALRKKSVWVRIAIATVIICSGSAWLLAGEFGTILAVLSGAAYMLLLIGLMFLIGRLFLPRRVRRIFAQQKGLHGETAIEWSDETITLRSPHGMTKYLWSDYHRVMEDKRCILLMQSDAVFNFIPKRVLSEDQAADIMRQARGEQPSVT